MRKIFVFAGWFVVFLFFMVDSSYALGVGAVATRVVQNGKLLHVKGRSSPRAKVVIVDSQENILAVAFVEKTGRFEFDFAIEPDLNTAELVIFGVDELGTTNKVALSGYIKSGREILLPPTVVEDQVSESKKTLELKGLVYPNSQVDIHVYSNNGFDDVYSKFAGENGEWSFASGELPVGDYRVEVSSQSENLKSELSQEVFFNISGVKSEPLVTKLRLPGQLELPVGFVDMAERVGWTGLGGVLLFVLGLIIFSLWWWFRGRKISLVLESDTGKGVGGAVIKIYDVVSSGLVVEAETDRKGRAEIFLKKGGYKLDVVKKGVVADIDNQQAKIGYNVFDGSVIDIERDTYVKLLVWVKKVI